MIKLARYIPQGYKQFTPDIGDYPKDLFACYVNLEREKPVAMFFIRKQSKPAWHCSFHNVETLKKEIKDTISRLMSWEEMKEKRKQERKEDVLSVAVGQIYSYSWGYDQTNVDFYQVTEVKKKSFTMKAIGCKSQDNSSSDYNGMADRVIAVKNAFLNEEHNKPLNKRTLSMPHGSLHLTDEKETHYRSWYA